MSSRQRTVLSLFTGAGGLDIGFEREGFDHMGAVEIDPWCVSTLKKNRPRWPMLANDVRDYTPKASQRPDVLLAGPPCQGFSLGGNREAHDGRNLLYKEVLRVADALKPRVIVLENVLNLRTMRSPETGRPFSLQIAADLQELGYETDFNVFRVCHFGVPQTRRRFVFIGFKGHLPKGYFPPAGNGTVAARPFLYDLAQGRKADLPNHQPEWGFKSSVHVETGEPFDPREEVVPVRFSRTASDGNPVRSFDEPFPAVDTATIWGWAQGHVTAGRFNKDRANGKHIRNPHAKVTLWRITASRLRAFTHREYARLQTFPDDWEFLGDTKRSIHLQVGNAVPVAFAERLAQHVKAALTALELKKTFAVDDAGQA